MSVYTMLQARITVHSHVVCANTGVVSDVVHGTVCMTLACVNALAGALQAWRPSP